MQLAAQRDSLFVLGYTLHDTNPNGSTPDGFGLLDFTVDDEVEYVAQTQYAKPGVQILVKLK